MNDLVLPMCSPSYLEHLRAQADDIAGQLAAARLIDSVKALYRWDFWLASNRIELADSSISAASAKAPVGRADCRLTAGRHCTCRIRL